MPWRPVPRPAAAGSNPRPSSTTSNVSSTVGLREPDLARRRVRVLRDVVQGLEAAEVDGGLDVLPVPTDAVRLHGDGHGGLPRVGFQRGRQALVGEQRRVDASCEVPEVPERLRRLDLEVREDRRAPSRDRARPAAPPGGASPRARRAVAARRRGCSVPASGRARPGRSRCGDATPAGPRSVGRSAGRAPPAPPCRARASPSSRSSGRPPSSRPRARRGALPDVAPRTTSVVAEGRQLVAAHGRTRERSEPRPATMTPLAARSRCGARPAPSAPRSPRRGAVPSEGGRPRSSRSPRRVRRTRRGPRTGSIACRRRSGSPNGAPEIAPG